MNFMDVDFAQWSTWIQENFLTWNAALQVGIILLMGLIARLVGPSLKNKSQISTWIRKLTGDRESKIQSLAAIVDNLIPLVTWVVLLWVGIFASQMLEQSDNIIRIVAGLVSAWILVQLISGFVKSEFWSRILVVICWTVAALFILNILQPTLELLDSVAVQLGDTRLSPLKAINVLLLGGILLWIANAVSRLVSIQLEHVPDFTPSIKVLINKIIRFSLIFLAIIIALTAIGIKLTALAVLSGAIGIGIGFGLQKIVSNFVSGIIVLLDRSIRPNDVIEIEGTYGTVKSLGARYTSVITRDGTEYLIPNESLITQQVVNWSYSDTNVRRKVSIGVSYNSDIELARELVLEAIKETERIVKYPEPKCHLLGFGDNSVDLEARYWISDPENGVANVRSDFLRKVWKKFQDNDIEIPFPQRDLNIRGGSSIDVRLQNNQD